MIHYTEHTSPLGPLLLVANEAGLQAIYFQEHRHFAGLEQAVADGWQRNDAHPVLRETARQLDRYFAGQLTHFDLPLAAAGTPFQQSVWLGLTRIPYGQTSSYGGLADAIGNRAAVRAVGAANGRNPLSIVVPCHRVIGGDGALTGYAGGLERKRYLLALEARTLAASKAAA
ncbi:MAG TPA: methylated-DNA--[protein]-cysteine S-methyltransferase [Burkholderiaceae bacterium]